MTVGAFRYEVVSGAGGSMGKELPLATLAAGFAGKRLNTASRLGPDATQVTLVSIRKARSVSSTRFAI